MRRSWQLAEDMRSEITSTDRANSNLQVIGGRLRTCWLLGTVLAAFAAAESAQQAVSTGVSDGGSSAVRRPPFSRGLAFALSIYGWYRIAAQTWLRYARSIAVTLSCAARQPRVLGLSLCEIVSVPQETLRDNAPFTEAALAGCPPSRPPFDRHASHIAWCARRTLRRPAGRCSRSATPPTRRWRQTTRSALLQPRCALGTAAEVQPSRMAEHVLVVIQQQLESSSDKARPSCVRRHPKRGQAGCSMSSAGRMSQHQTPFSVTSKSHPHKSCLSTNTGLMAR